MGRRKASVKSGWAKAVVGKFSSQDEAARQTGVAQSTISRIVAGRQITEETERKVLSAA